MKLNRIVRKRLLEQVTETGFLVYHGSELEINNFVDDFVGGKDANDAEGPGIYFTTDYDDACGYGPYIYTVRLRGNFVVSSGDPHGIDRELMMTLAKMAEDWEMEAQNYDEDPDTGIEVMVDSAFEYNEDENGVIQQIWINLYRERGVNFVRNCVKLGIDGIVVDRYRNSENKGKHVVLYNTSVMEVVDKEKI